MYILYRSILCALYVMLTVINNKYIEISIIIIMIISIIIGLLYLKSSPEFDKVIIILF